MGPISFTVGGRLIADTADLVRRYAGLPWSGGPPEVWAWPYYDLVPSAPDNTVTPLDVLAAGALHPGLSRRDLAFFVERSADLAAWLAVVPTDEAQEPATLWFADDGLLDHVGELARLADGVQLTLLSKVLHRKRPGVVPLLDRHIVDRYRPVTGERRPIEAWPGVLRGIRDDLASPEDRFVLLMAASEIARESAGPDGEATDLGLLRFIDIAVWMESR